MKHILLSMIALFFTAGSVNAGCLVDQGPRQDGAGFANFEFYNSCDQNVTVHLCVKTLAGTTTFNNYSANINRLSSYTITAGRWSTFDSYRWSEETRATCPFFN